MNEYITKNDAILVIHILAGKMNDENIDVAAKQFCDAIRDLNHIDFEDEIYELKEKLRKERKKKKRWKRKWLDLKQTYDSDCSLDKRLYLNE